ncbi:TonB-dependent receptor plug domain-containing protein [Pseudemcibacter aquimaris]|uniref:TonB-dependent receptor plug domain-containing protein n=1 Tax=Pseudemcibacter aquimaris TaxID=2857064 RepID=UPI002012CBC5|nr:TonB-dependent receptor [Pseudemcibacter aquimaris]MCC3859817.1 TonB-dependent receptor [Pseudemcibacter aquimaris]WDU60211.1 TonB-dependent receptor [Pseudemcibacter aquimaris]
MGRNSKFKVILLSTVFGFSQITYAQKVETVGDASVVTYEKSYFDSYNAVTLLDMLNIIPGAKEILDKNKNQRRGGGGGGRGGGDRGFGAGGDQILIDGKRLAGKTNSVDDTLGRISADQIEKIELIRGATAGLDVQSQGLVINITLAEGASSSTTFWKVQNRYTIHHRNQPGFLVSHSGSKDALDYTLSVERRRGGFNNERLEGFYDDVGVKTADQFIDNSFDFKTVEIVSNLTYGFEDGSTFRLNGLFDPGRWTGLETRDKTSDTLRPLTWNTQGKNNKWEIGGDYTRNFDALGNFKFLFLINGEDKKETHNRFNGTGPEEFEYNIENTAENKKERIFRSSLTTSLTEKQSLEYGAEVAINTSHREFRNEERENAGDALDLTNSDFVDIKENRYELFAIHSYNISSKLVMQTSLITEFSKIIADNVFAGGTPTTRNTSFTYFKPRVNLRYDLTNSDQLRATAEKKVSQLNFNNFVTRFDRMANVLRVGNTNIRPEQVWEYSLQYEHRFPNDGGSFDIELYYHDFNDHITRVDFTEYVDFGGDEIGIDEFFALPPTTALRDSIDFISKSGNIPDATAYGLKANTSVRLGFVGLNNAVLGLSYEYDKTEAIDQFTGEKRMFDWRSPHTFGVNFRHDLNELGVSYGFTGELQSDRVSNDINYSWPSNPSVSLEAFAEYTFNNGIKMRLEAENINTQRWDAEFNYYTDHKRFDEFGGTITRLEKQATEITFSLQGTF